MIRSLLIFVSILALSVATAQNGIEYMDGIVIVKLNPKHRALGDGDTLNHENLINAFSALRVKRVDQKFPRAERIESSRMLAPTQGPDKRVDISLIYEIEYDASVHPLKAASIIGASGLFDYSEAKIIPQLLVIPNDTLLSEAWHLPAIRAFKAWDIDTGSADVVIAIVDTGVDWDHPDMWPSIKENENEIPNNGIDDDENGFIDDRIGWNFFDDNNDPNETRFSHGTHVAGLSGATANNLYGIAGTGWACKIMAIKSGDINLPYGYEGIIYAADNGADIINCSWGSFGASQFAHDVVKYATYNKGAFLLGGAGNDNRENRFYPASYPEMLSVGSSNIDDAKADFSNYNYDIDLIAPGKNIFSLKNDTFGFDSGTSMSAPIVAGVAGLIKHMYPTYTPLQIRELLRVTANDTIYIVDSMNLYTGKLGTGRLDMLAALSPTNSPALRIDNFELTDGDDDIIKSGEAFTLGVEIGNYLDPIDDVTLTLESLSEFVTVEEGMWDIASLGTLSFTNNFTLPFKLRAQGSPAYDQEVDLKITATSPNTNYVYEKYMTVQVNPSYVNVMVNDVRTTISKHGLIGYTSFLRSTGLGFEVDTHGNVLYEAGLMIGRKSPFSTDVVDRVRSPRGADQDFWEEAVIERMVPEGEEAFLARGSFVDTSAIDDEIGLLIEQEIRAYDEEGHRNYVILDYTVHNKSGSDLTELAAGIFADWDVSSWPLENKGETAYGKRLGYIYYTGDESLCAGVQVLSAQPFHSYMIDNVPGGGGGVDMYDQDGFTSIEKFTTLTTDRLTGGEQGEDEKGNDVVQVASVDKLSLPSDGSVNVVFALHAARNIDDLLASADSAYVRENGYLPGENLSSPFAVRSVWPNPLEPGDDLNVTLDQKVLGSVQLEVFGSDGTRIMEHTSDELYPGFNQLTLELPELETGIYFLKVFVNGYDEVYRLAYIVR